MEKEVWYRYEEVQYAGHVDESGWSSSPGQMLVHLREFEVLKHTPKGVWLRTYSGDKRFAFNAAHKRYACPSKELAKESFIARKKRQAAIYLARAAQAKRALALAAFL